MNEFISSMNKNNGVTFNGMPTNRTATNPILDLFFLIGASRAMSENDLKSLFNAAFTKDFRAALKILFYARDIEKGLGERRVFRTLMHYIVTSNVDIADTLFNSKNLSENIIRVDDIVSLLSTLIKANGLGHYTEFINRGITFLLEELKNKTYGSIVAKWMPRKKSQYSNLVHYMRKNGFIVNYTTYRKMIVNLTNVVEQPMSAKEWDGINLEHVPSIAMKKYKKAFDRHNILKPFVDKVVAGEAKINAKRLFPSDITLEIIKGGQFGATNRSLLNEQWKNLAKLNDLPEDFRAIPVIDVSGSMTMNGSIPMAMSTGVGLFMAENNPNKAFRDYFITFSAHPIFQKIFGYDIVEKVKNAMGADWGMNTDLEAVFKLILERAKENAVDATEMPTHVVVISDMEFDRCVIKNSDNAHMMIERMYVEAGYNLPTIVYWNVNGRVGNVPAQLNDKGALLVSGASQNVINFVLKKGYENMMSLVDEIINNPRYDHIG